MPDQVWLRSTSKKWQGDGASPAAEGIRGIKALKPAGSGVQVVNGARASVRFALPFAIFGSEVIPSAWLVNF